MKNSVLCAPRRVQVPVVHILVGPINLPQSSSLQSPDPQISCSGLNSLFSFLNQQNFLSTIDIL